MFLFFNNDFEKIYRRKHSRARRHWVHLNGLGFNEPKLSRDTYWQTSKIPYLQNSLNHNQFPHGLCCAKSARWG
jgi:hypothetical protein